MHKQLHSEKSLKFLEVTSWHWTIDLANFNFSLNQTWKMFDAKPYNHIAAVSNFLASNRSH